MRAETSETMVTERKQEASVKFVDTNGKELKQVDCFKYLGTVMETEGGSNKAVKQSEISMDEMERNVWSYL